MSYEKKPETGVGWDDELVKKNEEFLRSETRRRGGPPGETDDLVSRALVNSYKNGQPVQDKAA